MLGSLPQHTKRSLSDYFITAKADGTRYLVVVGEHRIISWIEMLKFMFSWVFLDIERVFREFVRLDVEVRVMF